MAQAVKHPWDAWNKEMPKIGDKVNCPDYKILNSKEHMRKILNETRKKVFEMASKSLDHIENGAIILAGGKDSDFEFYDNDTLHCNFRQEPFFRYLFGLNEPNAMGILDLKQQETILLLTPMPLSSERWLGQRRSFEYYRQEYNVNEVDAIQHIHDILQKRNIKYLYLLQGINSDSGLSIKTIVDFKEMNDHYWINYKQLYYLLCEARVHKTLSEIELLRIACKVTSQAHIYSMKHAQIGMNERHLEALFKSWTNYYGGSRHEAYECICGSGMNGAILHYGHAGYPNDCELLDGNTVVCDMGSEYNGYATDITCSYPINGKFNEDQKKIHTAVYEAQQNVLKSMKPGVSWVDMHKLAEKTILKHLINMNIINFSVNEDDNNNNNNNDLKQDNDNDENLQKKIDLLMKLNIASLFMPHGLGHFVGLTVHDVGGFNDEHSRCKELGACWLRTTRILQPNMFITVEPGLYFNKSWIKQMIEQYPQMGKYLNHKVLEKFYQYGGCRLEDDVLVTKDGIENFTLCPRSCEEIEQVMSK